MAEKEEKKETKEEKEPKPQAKKPKMPLMIGGGILLIVVLIIVGGIFAMKSFSQPSDAAEKNPDGEEKTTSTSTDGEPVESTGIYFQAFDAFITVLKPSEEYRFTYLKFVPEFELSNQEVEREIPTKLPVLVSQINSIMTDLEWASIKSEKGRERLAEKIRIKLNENLKTGEIIRVFFTTFVAQ